MTEPDDQAVVIGEGLPWPWGDSLVTERGFGWHPDLGNMLLLVEDDVTNQMCDDLSGSVDMLLLAHGPLVGLLVRFNGGWGWMETMAWRGPGEGIPRIFSVDADPASGDHLFFQVTLVDRTTRIVRRRKGFTVSPHFTHTLIREVRDRWANEVTPEEGVRYREEWNRKYPTINAARKASIVRSRSGA